MKLSKISGILFVALFSGQASLAWCVTDATPGSAPGSKSQSKQVRKPATKKVAKQTTTPVPGVATPAAAPAGAPYAAPVLPAAVPTASSVNPYLAASAPAAVAPAASASPANAAVASPPYANVNPYLAYAPPTQQSDPFHVVSDSFSKVGAALPSLGGNSAESLLPSIKKVYPTGEKPLVVVTFKCPIEMVGVKGGPTKILHDVVNLGMDAVNTTNLLSFNLQQVCQ